MSLEDVADKARRNLMILTTGILAVVALGIPLDGKLVGAVDLKEVDPTRAWICAIVALGYFYLRFRLSPEIQKTRSLYQRDKKLAREARDEKYVLEQYGKLTQGAKPKLHFKIPALPKHNYRPGELVAKPITLAPESFRGRPGSIKFHWHLVEGIGYANLLPADAKFKIPWHWILFRNIRGHVGRVFKVGWNGLEVTLPTAMTVAALTICIWKVGISEGYWTPFF